MDAAALSLVAGSVLSIVFTFIPGLSDWYGGLEAKAKAQVMAIALLIVAIGIVLGSCFGLLNVVECKQPSVVRFALDVLAVSILALSANQGTYLITRNLK